jgi:hypothetical protein
MKNQFEPHSKINSTPPNTQEIPIEYNLEINSESPEIIIIKDKEIVRIPTEEIAPRIFEIFKKVKADEIREIVEDPKYDYDSEDIFILNDKISIIYNTSVGVLGPETFYIDLKLIGILKDLEVTYKEAIEKKVKELNLEKDQLYALRSWKQEFDILDKDVSKIEDINDHTVFKHWGSRSFIAECKPDI